MANTERLRHIIETVTTSIGVKPAQLFGLLALLHWKESDSGSQGEFPRRLFRGVSAKALRTRSWSWRRHFSAHKTYSGSGSVSSSSSASSSSLCGHEQTLSRTRILLYRTYVSGTVLGAETLPSQFCILSLKELVIIAAIAAP